MTPLRRRLKWYRRGRDFGYPLCCILRFVVQGGAGRPATVRIGYVPCGVFHRQDVMAEMGELLAENERLKEALAACSGFLVGLRDDDHDYDFTLSHNEQISRLCHQAWEALRG